MIKLIYVRLHDYCLGSICPAPHPPPHQSHEHIMFSFHCSGVSASWRGTPGWHFDMLFSLDSLSIITSRNFLISCWLNVNLALPGWGTAGWIHAFSLCSQTFFLSALLTSLAGIDSCCSWVFFFLLRGDFSGIHLVLMRVKGWASRMYAHK